RSHCDQFRPHLVAPDERRPPVALLVAVNTPDLPARLRVEGGEVGLLLVVVDDEQTVIVQGRRGRGAPAHARLDRIELLLPEQLAVVAQTEDTDVAEAGVDALAVDGRRL